MQRNVHYYLVYGNRGMHSFSDKSEPKESLFSFVVWHNYIEQYIHLWYGIMLRHTMKYKATKMMDKCSEVCGSVPS